MEYSVVKVSRPTEGERFDRYETVGYFMTTPLGLQYAKRTADEFAARHHEPNVVFQVWCDERLVYQPGRHTWEYCSGTEPSLESD